MKELKVFFSEIRNPEFRKQQYQNPEFLLLNSIIISNYSDKLRLLNDKWLFFPLNKYELKILILLLAKHLKH